MARRGLDAEIVVETAEGLVDADGWTNLTMTALAKELGVRTPSLYSHVASIEEVLAALQGRTLRALGERLQHAAMGTTGAAGFRAMAQALREFAGEHPGAYELAMTEPIDRDAVLVASTAAFDALTAMIRSFGVDEVTPELLFSCVAQLHGVLALDRSGLFRSASLDMDQAYASATESVVHLLEEAGGGARR